MEILDAARKLGGNNPLVLPMRIRKPISSSTLPKVFQYVWIAAAAHGFRSSFWDWVANQTNHPPEAIDAAPAYAV